MLHTCSAAMRFCWARKSARSFCLFSNTEDAVLISATIRSNVLNVPAWILCSLWTFRCRSGVSVILPAWIELRSAIIFAKSASFFMWCACACFSWRYAVPWAIMLFFSSMLFFTNLMFGVNTATYKGFDLLSLPVCMVIFFPAILPAVLFSIFI